MELHARRARLRANAEAEAAGQVLWTDEFSRVARTRLWTVLDAAATYTWDDSGLRNAIAEDVEFLLRSQLGESLGSGASTYWFMVGSRLDDWDNDLVPSLIEAVLYVFHRRAEEPTYLVSEVNRILDEERISYDLIDGQMVEFESREMHVEVVAPMLRLLGGRSGWDAVEASYQTALREISEDPSDAITDAGRALQEALELLGCSGNALGPLIRSARAKGVMAPHDSKLAEGIESIAHWVSADRSEKGDTHGASGATRDDAWLAVHVVGALVLPLASGSSR